MKCAKFVTLSCIFVRVAFQWSLISRSLKTATMKLSFVDLKLKGNDETISLSHFFLILFSPFCQHLSSTLLCQESLTQKMLVFLVHCWNCVHIHKKISILKTKCLQEVWVWGNKTTFPHILNFHLWNIHSSRMKTTTNN